MKVVKSGRSSGVTSGIVFDCHATVKVYGYPWEEEYAIFEDQIVIKPAMAAPGDSGSCLLEEANRLVGLIFAGSDTFAVANKASHVVELLNLDIPSVGVVKAGMPLLFGLSLLPFIWRYPSFSHAVGASYVKSF